MNVYFKSALLSVCVMFAVSLVIPTVEFTVNANGNYKLEQENRVIFQTINTYREVTNKQDSLKIALIADVDSYIKKIAPRSKVKAERVVELSLKHNFDITLLLAQAHLEGHFATAGRPARTNSMFGVGAYDNGKDLYKYKDPNESIEPYIILMKERYIKEADKYDPDVVTKLARRNFRSRHGHLYAQNQNYGAAVSRLVSEIERAYTIKDCQINFVELETIKRTIDSGLTMNNE